MPTNYYGSGLEEQLRQQEDELLRQRMEKERIEAEQRAAEEAAAAAREAEAAQTEAASVDQNAASEAPDPVFAGVRSAGAGVVDRQRLAYTHETRKAISDTGFTIGKYDTEEGYTPEEDRAMLEKRLLAHALDNPTKEETQNDTYINYDTIRNKEQAFAFMPVYSDNSAKVAGAKRMAKQLGMDLETFLSEAENYQFDKFGRNLFPSPYSDAAKNRAYSAGVQSIGLTGVDGQALDPYKMTTADMLLACRMDPSGATADAMYELAKAGSQIPGNPWYGQTVEKDMFKFVDSADLTMEGYKEEIAAINESFTYSSERGVKNPNVATLAELYGEIKADYADKPRVMGYYLRDLKKSFTDHTGLEAPPDALLDKILADTAEARDAAKNATDDPEEGKKGAIAAIKEFLFGAPEAAGDLSEAKPEEKKPETKTVEQIISEIEAEDAKKAASGGSSVITSGGTATVNGQNVQISPPIASTGMPPMQDLFGESEQESAVTDGFDNPMGMSEEWLNKAKGKAEAEAYGPTDRLEYLPYDSEMTDAQAWMYQQAGYVLAPENQNQISRYANNEFAGLMTGELAVESGDPHVFRKHGSVLGETAQAIATSGLRGEARADAELALLSLAADIYDMYTDVQNPIVRPSGANMYDYAFFLDSALVDRNAAIMDSLKTAKGAYSENVVQAAEERQARMDGYAQTVMAGNGDEHAANELAQYYAGDMVDIYSDDTYNEMIDTMSPWGDYFGEDGTFWQGDSMAAQEARNIMIAGGKQCFYNFQNDLYMRVEDLLGGYTTAAHNMGMTLGDFLKGSNIGGLDQVVRIAYNSIQAEGNAIANDKEFQAMANTAAQNPQGTADIVFGGENRLTTGDAIGHGVNTAWTDYKESFAHAAYTMMDLAMYDATTQETHREYRAKYGEDAEAMRRRDLNAVITSGELSEDMANELRRDMARAYNIFDVCYDIDATGLKGYARQSASELGKKLDMLRRVTATLEPEQQQLVNMVSGISGNLIGSAVQIGATGVGMAIGMPASVAGFIGSAAGFGMTTFDDAYRANESQVGMSRATAAKAAALETVGMTAIESLNMESLSGLFFGGATMNGVNKAMRNGGLKNIARALAVQSLTGMGGEALEEGMQTGVVPLFDALDQEFLAYDRGEGFNILRSFGHIERELKATDYTELGKEVISSMGAGAAYGGVYALIGLPFSGRAALKDAHAYNQYESVQLATQIAEGDLEANNENLGKVYAALKEDLQDANFRRYLDKGSKQANQNRNIMTAMLEGTMLDTLDAATDHALKANEYDKKADAAGKAVENSKGDYLSLRELVANGDLDKKVALESAQNRWAKAVTTYNEAKNAAEKERNTAARSVNAWLDGCKERGKVLTAEGMQTRMEQIANVRMGIAKRLDTLYSAMDRAAAERDDMQELQYNSGNVIARGYDSGDGDILELNKTAKGARKKTAEAVGKADMGADYAENAVFSEETEIDNEEMEAVEAESIEAQVDNILSYKEEVDAGENAEAQVAAENMLAGAVETVNEALGEVLDEAYDAYHNVGDAAAYNEMAKRYNDAVRKLREAGVEAGEDGELPLVDEAAYTPEEPAPKQTQPEAREYRRTARKYANISEEDAQKEADMLLSEMDGLEREKVEAEDYETNEETKAYFDSNISAAEKKLEILDDSLAAKEAEITASEEYAYAKENLDEDTASAIAWPSRIRGVISRRVNRRSDAKSDAEAAPEAKLSSEAEAQLEQIHEKRDTKKREELAKRREAEKKAAREAARRERVKDVVTGTTKEQRDAQKDEEQAQANVDAMDVEAFIAEKYPDATEEQKDEIRKRWADNAKKASGETPKDITAFVARIVKKFKVPIKFVDTLDGAEGEYDGKSILIARDATQGEIMRKVILHELTHKAEGSKLYGKLSKMILDMKYGGDQAQMDADIKSTISRYQAFYDKKGRKDKFTEANARQEIVADLIGEMLDGNQEMIDRLVADEPSVAQKIVDTVKGVIDKLRGVKDSEVDKMRKAVRLFERAIKKAKKTSGKAQNSIPAQTESKAETLEENVKFSLPSGDALDAEIRAWRANHQAQIDAAITNDGVSKFAEDTVQRAERVPVEVKQEFATNPLLRTYAKDTNEDQMKRAQDNIEQNGYENEVERLLDADHFTAEDNVEAGMIAISSFESGDIATGLEMALKYRTVGTEQAQAMQSRKMFAGMSPTHIKLKVAGETEQMLSDFIEGHQPKAKEVNARAKAADDLIRDMQGGDESARVMEGGDYTIDAINSKWGMPINEKQRALIDHYKLNNVARPGLYYNRATTKQRMLEAILATPDPDANSGNGLTLTQRLEWMKEGKAVVTQADLDYISDQIRQYSEMPEEDQAARAGDLALARAFEAYGNIKQPTKLEKARTWRYVSMLLSLPSAERNVIGNSVMNAVNAATHDTVGVFADWVTSLFTGQRTTANISFKERAEGWNAWADETANTFRDYFMDKADATPSAQGEDRFNKNQRGRVYQTQAFEDMRLVEGFLMSVGDRNFWKKAYVNSLAEQQRVADMNGVELDYSKACEIAKAEANYATFNEDNFLRNWLSEARKNPYVGFVLDMVMPFTGVPTNITKRMVEYSPLGMAMTFLKHGGRAMTGANFDQRAFVEGVSRGLSGTALWMIGMGLGQLGAINLGTGGEDDEKVYNLKASLGEQYSPFIRIGDENISLAAFAPAISPIIMGATAYDILKESDDKVQAFTNALTSSLDQIFDASYMSGLADLFDRNGTIAENAMNTLVTNLVSQNVPAFMTQIATAMDPYVRDTKDANAIMQAVKNGLIARIPGVRTQYLNEKTDIAGQAFESKEGIRNFIDPFTTTKVNDDPALIELDRLYDELGSSTHIPSYLVKTSGKVQILAAIADDRKVNMDRAAGENKLVLTANERNYYNRMYSQLCFEGTGDAKYQKIGKADTKFDGIRETMESRKYQRASDEEKADMLADILSKAKMLTQAQMVIDMGYVD